MDNVGPADGGGSKKREPLFPDEDGSTRRHLTTVKALAGGEVALTFEEGGCVVIRDKHGATVLRITHRGMHHGEHTLDVVPYSAGAPDAEGFDDGEPDDEGYHIRCDV